MWIISTIVIAISLLLILFLFKRNIFNIIIVIGMIIYIELVMMCSFFVDMLFIFTYIFYFFMIYSLTLLSFNFLISIILVLTCLWNLVIGVIWLLGFLIFSCLFECCITKSLCFKWRGMISLAGRLFNWKINWACRMLKW